MVAEIPETANFSEFAKIIRRRSSYVTQLRKDDRLVLTGNKRRVEVAESIARIEQTGDPSKQGVADRHEAARQNADGDAAISEPLPQASTAVDYGGDRISSTYQDSRAVRERYLAMEAKRAYEEAVGKLMQADEVQSAVAKAVSTMRVQFENLPATLGPQLAPITDESQVRAVLTQAVEHILEETYRNLTKLSTRNDK